MKKYESPLGFPDEHMRLLGLIAAHWESFELVLNRTLARTMSHEHARVALFTSSMAFAAKLDLLTIHVRDAFVDSASSPDEWTAYNKIVKRISAAYAARNRYVHAQWLFDKDSGDFVRHGIRTRGGKLAIADEATSPEQMADVAREITEAGEEFVRFFLDRGIGPKESHADNPQSNSDAT